MWGPSTNQTGGFYANQLAHTYHNFLFFSLFKHSMMVQSLLKPSNQFFLVTQKKKLIRKNYKMWGWHGSPLAIFQHYFYFIFSKAIQYGGLQHISKSWWWCILGCARLRNMKRWIWNGKKWKEKLLARCLMYSTSFLAHVCVCVFFVGAKSLFRLLFSKTQWNIFVKDTPLAIVYRSSSIAKMKQNIWINQRRWNCMDEGRYLINL